MDINAFNKKYSDWTNTINNALGNLLAEKESPENTIYKAMRYSLMAGGKRLRPVLSLAVCDMLDGDIEEVLPFACAIEMIHTYSLIHDDLPAMDNDDYRRGRLTNHKVYGEAMAVLAGDALLNHAFETMLGHALSSGRNIERKVRAMELISKASGSSGMIGGQVVDLECEEKEISEELLKYMHKCKTGEMIKVSVMSAAVLANADSSALKSLESYSEKIGLAFQIRDDIMDIEGNFKEMGKKTGSDAANNKSTFISFHGLDGSKKILKELTDEAVKSIEAFGEKAEFLKLLAKQLETRTN